MEDNSIKNILVTSDEPWCETWHTQLHYAFQLSKRTNVVFLDPPDPWKISNLFIFKQSTQQISDNLLVVKYQNILPASFGKLALFVNDKFNELLLTKNGIIKKSSDKGILWHFDSHRSYYIFKKSNSWKHLFHVIDPIAGCNYDVILSKLADLIVVTSPKFVDYYKSLNKNVLQIGQGVDLNFYQRNIEDKLELVSDDSIMLLGTITDQIHFKLLIAIAERFPGKLVIIGPDKIQNDEARKLFNLLINIKGVEWLGAMPPNDFKKHLIRCRVGIIAYDNNVNYKNDFRSPLKVISYLACRKPIISNIDCEIPSLKNKAIYNVIGDDEYFGLIEKAYNNNLTFDNKEVDSFLDSINYDRLLNNIFDAIHLTLPPLK